MKRLPKNVVILGLVSFLNDTASEMIYPLLPIFITKVLGLSALALGGIEGIAESSSSLLKILGGYLSDRLGRRKLLALIGYTISAISKPLLGLSETGSGVMTLRFLDRAGKGIRTSPRDALIADSTEPSLYGKAFGFHRAMDTLGAILGPAIAFALLPRINFDYRTLFILTAIPGAFAVMILAFHVREAISLKPGEKPYLKSLKELPRELKLFLVIALIFSLGNSSNTFLLLRAQEMGAPTAVLPLMWLFVNVCYTFSAYYGGALSDKLGRINMIFIGFLLYSLAYTGFALAYTTFYAWLLFGLYGIYLGITDGVERAFIADMAPEHIRGTAYGIYHTLTGVALLPASLLTGFLWDKYGSPFALSICAGLSLISAGLLLTLIPSKLRKSE
ncbi:MAG: MFS transporter [Synergistetes bacterium]|nr:MFS transporter [Synergistota bacterium]